MKRRFVDLFKGEPTHPCVQSVNGKWVVAYERGGRFVVPGHTGMKDSPLAFVGDLTEGSKYGYVYSNKRDAVERAKELFPYRRYT
jgi:hypothetical protein